MGVWWIPKESDVRHTMGRLVVGIVAWLFTLAGSGLLLLALFR